jgi:hypothetical protein
MSNNQMGQQYSISIFLENISSIEIKYKSNIILMALGIISSVFGGFSAVGGSFVNEYNVIQMGILLIILGILLLIFWGLSRTHIIAVASNGGSTINISIKNMNNEVIDNFIYETSFAQLNRLNKLNNLKISFLCHLFVPLFDIFIEIMTNLIKHKILNNNILCFIRYFS